MTHIKRLAIGSGFLIAVVAAVELAEWLVPHGGLIVVLGAVSWAIGWSIEDLRREGS